MPLQLINKPPYYTTNNTVKIYIAIANQTGTQAPIMTILQNTIGDIVWTRTIPGVYKATLEDAFPAGKTLMFVGQGNFLENGINYFDQLTPPHELNLQTCIDAFNTPGDDKLSNTPIQIFVYP